VRARNRLNRQISFLLLIPHCLRLFYEATLVTTCQLCCLNYLIMSARKKNCDLFYNDNHAMSELRWYVVRSPKVELS
jgi:hypothetical protein